MDGSLMSLRPGGERRISAAIEWIETAIEAKKKKAPGRINFQMHFDFDSIIVICEKLGPIAILSNRPVP